MSYEATTWAWQQPLGNPVRKLILLHMADAASAQNSYQSWHSLASIADRCNCSRGSVRTHLAALVESGYLTLVRESCRNNRPAVYRLNVGQITVQVGPSGGTGDVQGGTGAIQLGGATDIHGVQLLSVGVQLLNKGGTGVVPEPVIEPVKEPISEKNVCVDFSLTDFKQPDFIPDDLWAAYFESRKSLAKNPMSNSALQSCVDSIAACVKAGYSVETVLDAMTAKSWRICRPDWLVNWKRINPNPVKKSSVVAMQPSSPKPVTTTPKRTPEEMAIGKLKAQELLNLNRSGARA